MNSFFAGKKTENTILEGFFENGVVKVERLYCIIHSKQPLVVHWSLEDMIAYHGGILNMTIFEFVIMAYNIESADINCNYKSGKSWKKPVDIWRWHIGPGGLGKDWTL
jgi:hypothetical protein